MVSDNLVLCIYHPAMPRGATIVCHFLLLYPLSFELYPWPTGFGRQVLSFILCPLSFVLVYSILKTSSQNTSQSLPSSVWFVHRVLNKAVHPKL